MNAYSGNVIVVNLTRLYFLVAAAVAATAAAAVAAAAAAAAVVVVVVVVVDVHLIYSGLAPSFTGTKLS